MGFWWLSFVYLQPTFGFVIFNSTTKMHILYLIGVCTFSLEIVVVESLKWSSLGIIYHLWVVELRWIDSRFQLRIFWKHD